MMTTEEKLGAIVGADAEKPPVPMESILRLAVGKNKGWAEMNGKTLIVNERGEGIDANEVVESISKYSAAVATLIGKPAADRAGQEIAGSVNPAGRASLSPDQAIEPIVSALKQDGAMSANFDPKADVGVVSGGINMNDVGVSVKSALSLIEGGASALDASIAVSSDLAQTDSFKKATDSEKLFMLNAVAERVAEADKAWGVSTVMRAAEAVTAVENQAYEGIASSLQTSGGTFYEQLDPAKQKEALGAAIKYKVDAGNLSVLASEAELAADTAEREYREYVRANAGNFGTEEKQRELRTKQNAINALRLNAKTKKDASAHQLKEADRLQASAIKGVPHDIAATMLGVRQDVSSGIRSLNDPAEAVRAMSVSGKQIDYASMPREQQRSAVLTYAVNSWYEKAIDGAGKGLVPLLANIRNKMLTDISSGNASSELSAIADVVVERGNLQLDMKKQEAEDKSIKIADDIIQRLEQDVPVVKIGGSPFRLDSPYAYDRYEDEIRATLGHSPQALARAMQKLRGKRGVLQAELEAKYKLAQGTLGELEGGKASIAKQLKQKTGKRPSNDLMLDIFGATSGAEIDKDAKLTADTQE